MNDPNMQQVADALGVDAEQPVHDAAMSRLREDVMNSEPKFTPGPWVFETVKTSVGICHKIGRFPNTSYQKENYACVYVDHRRIEDCEFDPVCAELLANARLIAAAPALYAALKEAAHQLQITAEFLKMEMGECGTVTAIFAAESQARAALRLAVKGVE